MNVANCRQTTERVCETVDQASKAKQVNLTSIRLCDASYIIL